MELGRPQLIGLPYDASSSYLRGAADAPQLIRAALGSPAGNSWAEAGVDIAGAAGLEDAGDAVLSQGAGARAQIRAAIHAVLASGRRPIALGGDHSVTYPVLQAIHQAFGAVTVLHVDAHPDLYDSFEGDRYSHACPFARILEERLAARLVQVGIRCMTGHQREQAVRFGVEVIDMHAWSDGVRPKVSGPVYLSLDLDGIDPAHAPGVAHREPGGLTVRDVIGIVQRLSGPIVGADVVEYNPRQDLGGVTAAVAAKLVKELAGAMLGERSTGG